MLFSSLKKNENDEMKKKRTVVLDGLVVLAGGPEDTGATELLIGRSTGCCLTGVEGAGAVAAADTDKGSTGGGGGVVGCCCCCFVAA